MFRAVYLLVLLASAIAADSKSVDCAFSDKEGTCFGHDLKSKYFNLDPAFCNMNHGSFGVVAKPVSTAQQQFFLEQESHPDAWFRKSYFDYVEQARSAIATLVNANADDIVMVENASSAVNSILRSFGFQKGDKVLRLSSAYGMVSNTLNWLATTVGIEVIVVDVEYPVKDSTQIIKSVAEALRANPDIKLSIFSHISSTPAMIEPIEVLIPLAHAANSLVLVDGAHAPGVLDLNLTALNSDFYLGNCHKWLYAPKGTAFLYVKSSQQLENFPQPTVISSSGEPEYIGRYRYTGTRDYTGFSSIPVAVDFLSTLGGMKQIQTYNHELAVQGARYLVDAWKTYMLIPEPLSGYMVNIVLPSNDEDAVVDMQATLDSQYNIYIVVSSVPTTNADGTTSTIYFTRLSAQVYLEMSDFEQLGTLVPQLLAECAAKKNKGTTTN